MQLGEDPGEGRGGRTEAPSGTSRAQASASAAAGRRRAGNPALGRAERGNLLGGSGLFGFHGVSISRGMGGGAWGATDVQICV